jgi:hypothetical protein
MPPKFHAAHFHFGFHIDQLMLEPFFISLLKLRDLQLMDHKD